MSDSPMKSSTGYKTPSGQRLKRLFWRKDPSKLILVIGCAPVGLALVCLQLVLVIVFWPNATEVPSLDSVADASSPYDLEAFNITPTDSVVSVSERTASETEMKSFGVYTEERSVSNLLELALDPIPGKDSLGERSTIWGWNNLRRIHGELPAEGEVCWTNRAAPNKWFGLGIILGKLRDLSEYQNGFLNFSIKSTSVAPMKVGVKSSEGGRWVMLGDENAEFGFARDGEWHSVRVPIATFDIQDLTNIQQPFMLKGPPFPEAIEFSIDDIWWETGNLQATGLGLRTVN